MSESTIDRETASRINPLISPLWTEDTLDRAASVVSEIGYLVAEADTPPKHMFAIFDAISAALEWESENVSSAKQRRAELSHE